ncbi:MAG TPA: hypothetical protein VNJ71_08260 [Gemmatimonadales bacterium]|nr:hypothetical protein [Gemmatimonadales bacterium]
MRCSFRWWAAGGAVAALGVPLWFGHGGQVRDAASVLSVVCSLLHLVGHRGPWGRGSRRTFGVALAMAAMAGAAERLPAQEPCCAPQVLVFTGQAHRVLALVYQRHPTELMGCMMGERRGDTVRVERIAPADVDPEHSTPEHVMPRRTCEEAGWGPPVGLIHAHTSAERCWYFFPGTQVLTSDGQSFVRGPYPVDAILCGERVVWINRALVVREHPLPQREARPTD